VLIFSLQVTLDNPSSRRPVLSARPWVTFPVSERHCRWWITVYTCCLLNRIVCVNNLPRVAGWWLNQQLDHYFSALPIAPPRCRLIASKGQNCSSAAGKDPPCGWAEALKACCMFLLHRFTEQSSCRHSGAEAGTSAETDTTSHRWSVVDSAQFRERKQSAEGEAVYHVCKTLVGRISSDPRHTQRTSC